MKISFHRKLAATAPGRRDTKSEDPSTLFLNIQDLVEFPSNFSATGDESFIYYDRGLTGEANSSVSHSTIFFN
jgi:hypothetical protein